MDPKLLGALGGIALVAILLWPSGSSKKVERLFNEGEQMYGQSEYEEAISKYTQALEESTEWGVKTEVIDKDFPTLAKYKIAVCYSKLAEQTEDVSYYDNALENIEEVAPTATVPKHLEGLTYLWGHVLYKQEKFELAEPKFQALINNYPNSLFVENAWYAIGQLNYKLENYEDSRSAFKHVVDDFPNSTFRDDAQHLIAQGFLNEKNYEQASAEFDKLATEEYKNYVDLQAEAMYKAAYCMNQLGRDDDAIGRYTNFITKFPNSQYVTAAYFDQGAIYSKQKDYENARINYELALQNTEDRSLQAEIKSAIGRTYYDQEDYENAVVAYNELLDEYPESEFIAEARLGIADSYYKLSKWSEAAAGYELVISEHPDQLDFIPYCSYQIGGAYYEIGTNLRKSGEEAQAAENLEIALKWYQKTIDEYPTDPVAPHALYGAIWALNDLNRKEELEAIAQKFIEQNKADPELDIFAAEVQLKFADIKFNDFKRYEEAAEEYAKLWTYPPLPKFHRLKLIGKFQEGQAFYKAAMPSGFREGDSTEGVDFRTDLLEKSVKAYQDAVNTFEDSAFLIGVEDGRYDDFAERVEQVEACTMNQALAYEKLDDWSRARELYAAIPDASGNYEQAQLLIAQSHIKEGNPTAAIDIYNSIMDILSPDNRSLAEIKLADLLRAEERFAEAAEQYQNVVANNPSGEYADDAQYLIGLCYYKAAADDPAILDNSVAAFEKMIADYGDSPNAIEAYYGLALAYRDIALKRGDASQWPNVVATVDRANEKYADSQDDTVRKTIGHIDLVKATAIEKQGIDSDEQRQELVASLKRIVNNEVAPQDARTRAQLKIGHLYYKEKDYANALTEYQTFVQMFPDIGELVINALYQAAVCHYQLAEAASDEATKQLAYQNAANTAQRVIDKSSEVNDLISASYTLGLARLGVNDNKGAVEAFRQTTSYEGQTDDQGRQKLISQAHSRLAELNTAIGDYTASVQEYQYIIEHTEEDDLKGRSYFAMAYVLDAQLKKYDDALLGYQNAINLASDPLVQAQSYYRSGLIYQDKLKDLDKAVDMYEALVKGYSAST
ncbi:MAG: tetratricopeptide repeat protein, partial [Candidatus Poribacteria bacterium]|nr:tetratricopeptide repeat protein [Candidatus Poribacteria bacterium]